MGFRMAAAAMQRDEGRDYVMEGDGQKIVRMLQGSFATSANLEVIIQDFLSFISRFYSVSFNFMLNTCNRVAHEITKYTLSLELPLAWSRNYPEWAQREKEEVRVTHKSQNS